MLGGAAGGDLQFCHVRHSAAPTASGRTLSGGAAAETGIDFWPRCMHAEYGFRPTTKVAAALPSVT